MTNKELYKQAFSALHVSEDFSLEVNMENKKTHKNIKVAAVVLAAVLLLSVGTVAVASSAGARIIRSTSYVNAEDYMIDPVKLNEALQEGVGVFEKDTYIPTSFSNGMKFFRSDITHNNGVDEDGVSHEYEGLEVLYENGNRLVSYSLRPLIGEIDYSDPVYNRYELTTVNGVTVVCQDFVYRTVAADYQPTPEEQAEVDAGHLVLMPVADGVPTTLTIRVVQWYVGEIEYLLTSTDQATPVSVLLDMAAEIIGK